MNSYSREHVPHWQWPVEGDSRMETGKSECVSDVKALKSKTGRNIGCVCQIHTVHCWVKWVLGRFTYCVVCVCVRACARQISMNAQVVRSSPFWDVTQRRCAVSYGRFGTIYRTLEDRTDRLFRNADNYSSVTSKKSDYLIFTAPQAWNQALTHKR